LAERLQEIESRVEELVRAVRDLTARIERLEKREEVGPPPSAPPPGAPREPTAEAPRELEQGMLALLGRTLVVLGGGYLIRAMTDAGVLPPLGGVALGLLYAGFWIAAADRAAAASKRASATFHGIAAGLVAFPLLWETTTRLGFLPPSAAAALLVLAFGVAVGFAARRRLAVVGWVNAGLALGTAAGLLVATHHLIAAVAGLLAIAAVVEYLALRDLWVGLRWPTAIVVDTAVLVMIWLLTRRAGLPEGYPATPLSAAVALALALPALYWTALAVRTLLRRHAVSAFEVLQGAATLLLGLGGAWRMLRAQAAPTAPIGAAILVTGALGYAVAFAFVERRWGHDRNFYFYSTAGGMLTLLGSRLLLGPGLAAAWSVLALTVATLARRFDRMTLRFHGALYLCVAAGEAGLVGATWRSFLGPAPLGEPRPGVEAWLTAAAAVATYAVLALDARGGGRWRERLPQAIAGATTAGILAGLLMRGLAGFAASSASLATLRTAVLALIVLGSAWAARRFSLAELGLLVYPLLALGGLKLLMQDLPEGRPLTLFMSLGFYGGALIFGPRLLRS
jgi:hypothetical protein